MIAAAGGAAHLAGYLGLYVVASSRGTNTIGSLARLRLASLDCANAGGNSRWHTRHRFGGR